MACELMGETRWPGNSERFQKLKEILGNYERGFKGCRIISMGSKCPCELCLLDDFAQEVKEQNVLPT
jgi:hypothetical protein